MIQQVPVPKPLPYETLLIETIRSLAVDSGIVSSVVYKGSNALTDSTKDWPSGVHKNRLVKIVGDAAAGAGQIAVIDNNSRNTLVIKGSWFRAIGAGAAYVILDKDLAQILRDVFGGGSDISAANPLQVYDPAVEEKVKYTESSVSGNSGGDGAWHDALDVDTRGMKSFSAVVKNTDGANSLNWRLRARPSNYSAGADEEIPECPGEETLAFGEKGLVELMKSYSRVKIQVKSTLADTPADYTVDYLINR